MENKKSIWFKSYTLEDIRERTNKNLTKQMGIEITEIGEDYLCGKMPVDERTKQPYGLLHGGASCVLSESLGSVASNMVVNPEKNSIVGLEINANHIRPALSGYVHARCEAIHVGRKTHIWNINMYRDSDDKLTCTSRLTVMVVDKFKH